MDGPVTVVYWLFDSEQHFESFRSKYKENDGR